jgi:hypothetical protein
MTGFTRDQIHQRINGAAYCEQSKCRTAKRREGEVEDGHATSDSRDDFN